MSEYLTVEEQKLLDDWLKANNITYKRIHRDFSDVTVPASLVKHFFPGMVDLHNYPARNNTEMKLVNWQVFNRKVLSKLGLQQRKCVLEKLAFGIPSTTKFFLYQIMTFVNKKQLKAEKIEEEKKILMENDKSMLLTVTKKVDDEIVKEEKKFIPLEIFEKERVDLVSKNMEVKFLQHKIKEMKNNIGGLDTQIKEHFIRITTAELACLDSMLENAIQNSVKKKIIMKEFKARIKELEKIITLKQEEVDELSTELEKANKKIKNDVKNLEGSWMYKVIYFVMAEICCQLLAIGN